MWRLIIVKSSGIGGQAVIEGVMMKNKDRYVAVRLRSTGFWDGRL